MRLPKFRLALRFAALLLCAVASAGSQGQTGSPGLALTPALMEAGSPVLIHADAPAAAIIDGEWLGHKLEFFQARDGHGWFALAGVDVEATAGPSTLRVHVRPESGKIRDLSRMVEIHAAHYRTGSLTVAPKFVEPGTEELKQIEEEVQLKATVFAAALRSRYGRATFARPLPRRRPTASAHDACSMASWRAFTKGWTFAPSTGRLSGPETVASWCWRGDSTTRAIA